MSRKQQILSLARSGATQRAWETFVAAGLDREDMDCATLTLKGRLLKDRARLASGSLKTSLFAESAAAYEAAATLRADSYPLINAAAMALFAGERVRSELLASKVLHLIESGTDKGETPYWCEATRAEALLLLGRRNEAQAAFEQAVALSPHAWEDRAATLRQFALIVQAIGGAADWLDPFRAPPVLHFSGIMGIAAEDNEARKAIAQSIGQIAPGFAVGALAAGADIIAAEALVAHGAELHIVLPSEPSDFRRSSVEPFGADWTMRYDALLERVQSLVICSEGTLTSSAGVALAEYHAMGHAAELASQLETRAIALRIAPADRLGRDDPWVRSGREWHGVEISETSGNSASPLPEGELIFEVAIDGRTPTRFPRLDDAIEALEDAGGEIAALDCRVEGDTRVHAFLARAEAGLLVASRDAGLALLACGKVERIEPIGEMATPYGAVELCFTRLLAAEA